MHPAQTVRCEIAAYRPARLLHFAFDDCPIFSLNVVSAEQALQHGLNALGFGENQHSTCEFIQAVDHIYLLPGIVLFHMPAQMRIRRSFPFMDGGHGEQSDWFVDYKDIAVFIQDFQAIGKLQRSPARSNFKHISGMNHAGGNAAGNSVYSNTALREHLTQRSFGRSGNQEGECIQNGVGG